MKKRILFLALVLAVLSPVWPQGSPLAAKTSGLQKLSGFFNLYWDEKEGKLWLEVEKLGQEFLYATSVAAGLGSYDIRLDRNQPNRARVVRFERVGPKVFLYQKNLGFRATSDDPDVRAGVDDAFAQANLWGFDIAAEESGRLLVDATRFFLRDVCGAQGTLSRGGQGSYSLDASRSAFFLPRTKSFPKNTEIETTLTFASANPSPGVRQVAADPEAVVLREHHSLVQLPDGNFRPREFDPRADFQIVRFMDFGTPISQPIVKRYIHRHRLAKKDPGAKTSDPVEPIVYYIDRAAPEPIRSAMVEGAGWWNAAFEALGYRNAFQVKVLPEGVDPLDIRYNIVSWVNRATRGYAFGGAVVDPRTGEVIKGQIVIDALHVRQDYLLAQSITGNFEDGRNNSKELADMALASIKQIVCHEVGHALGPEHNFAGSVNDRASAMDYPAALIKIRPDETFDLSDAYVKGIGEWDKVLMAFGYQDFPPGADEGKELRAILDKAFSRGLIFLASDDVSQANWVSFNAQPYAQRWENGSDPVDELEHVMKIRSIALANFSEKRIPPAAPMATLGEVLVPAYLFHRYSVDGAAGVLGGQYYYHRLRGDVQKNPEIVPAAAQRRALAVLLQTITPEFLTIDKKILDLIPGRPAKYPRTPELFPAYTGQTFDPLAAAESAAQLTIRMILQPPRASRLVDFHSRNNDYPGLAEVVDRLLGATWKSSDKYASSPTQAEILRVVDNVALVYLMRLAQDETSTSPQARAVALLKLEELEAWLDSRAAQEKDVELRAHEKYGSGQIGLFLADPKGFKIPVLPTPPAGGPI